MNAPTYLGSRYFLERVLGQGPTGAVYHGQDLDRGCDVAIKLIHQRYCDDPRFPVRFRECLRRVAPLRHTHVAAVHDYGCLDSRYYIATDLIEGTDLASFLAARGPLAPTEAAAIAQQLCAGLDAVHSQGLVHAGVKPQNILLTADEQIKLTDTGLSRVVSDSGLSKTKLLVGSTPYMCPEQARGQKIGPAGDMYSAGVVLFEMLTSRRPFEADDAWSLVRMHAEQMPPSPRQFNSRTPAELSAIVMRALQKDPDRRYASSSEMGAALATAFMRGATLLRPFATLQAGSTSARSALSRKLARAIPNREADLRRPGPSLRPKVASTSMTLSIIAGVLIAIVGLSALSGVAWRAWTQSTYVDVGSSVTVGALHMNASRQHQLFLPALFKE